MSTSAFNNIDISTREAIEEILSAYATAMSGVRPNWYVKKRPDGPYLVIEFAAPSEHHYRVHNSIASALSEENPLKGRSTVQVRKTAARNRLVLPETQMLKKVIAESLTETRTVLTKIFSRVTQHPLPDLSNKSPQKQILSFMVAEVLVNLACLHTRCIQLKEARICTAG